MAIDYLEGIASDQISDADRTAINEVVDELKGKGELKITTDPQWTGVLDAQGQELVGKLRQLGALAGIDNKRQRRPDDVRINIFGKIFGALNMDSELEKYVTASSGGKSEYGAG